MLTRDGALLNAVVNITINLDNQQLIGRSATHGYKADGAGGFTSVLLSSGTLVENGSGNTENDYVDIAVNSGGAVWDLNFLRSGGTNALSFTAAFNRYKGTGDC